MTMITIRAGLMVARPFRFTPLKKPTLAFTHGDPLSSKSMNLTSLTVAQLKEAIAIKEKIEALEQERWHNCVLLGSLPSLGE